MRSYLVTMLACAALGLVVLMTLLTNSITITTPIGVPQTADAGLVGNPGSSGIGSSHGNFFNPSNPQDRSGNSNPQDMTQPRAINPQDVE
jgi:hypothetical protein